MPLTVLSDRHHELLRLLNNIIAAAGHNGQANTIADARRALAQAMARYLADKNMLVITPLRASPCLEHRELARRLTDEILSRRQSSIEHYGTWTMATIEADPREFRMEVRAFVRTFEKYLRHEQAHIHPRVIEAIQAAAAQRAA